MRRRHGGSWRKIRSSPEASPTASFVRSAFPCSAGAMAGRSRGDGVAYFLAKTEPGTYSIDDLKREGTAEWDGVRNPAAVNAIKMMRPGDVVIIYHSGRNAAVVGLAEVVSSPRPDKKDPRSWVAD